MQSYFIFRVFLVLLGSMSVAKRFKYFSTEHPKVTYVNGKYVSYGNLSSQRYGRSDPFYYVSIHTRTLVPFANDITISFNFFEWLTNVYKRSFVEMHFKLCDMIQKDTFFGPSFKQGKFVLPMDTFIGPSLTHGTVSQLSCPYPVGEYHFYNMTIPIKAVPPHFPFRMGRIYCNVTSMNTDELIASAHIDMEIKEFNTQKKKNN